MNKTKNILVFTIVLALLAGCVKEKELKPFLVPELVNSFIRKVEAFDEHKSLFVASDLGILVKYADQKQYIYNKSNAAFFDRIDWESAEVLYSNSDETFWLISDTLFIEIGRDRYDVHIDRTPFYSPTKYYYDYTVGPDGTLYRIGFYNEVWDPQNGFESEYFIGIYTFVGIPNNIWNEIQTNMTITSSNLTSPISVFNDVGQMVICTNPQYRVDGLPQEKISTSKIGKSGDGFDYRVIHEPFITSTGSVYGLEKKPKIFFPAENLRSTTLDGNVVEQFDISSLCDYPEEAVGAVKVLDWSDDRLRLYIQYFTNQLSEDTAYIGHIATYDFSSGDCDIKNLKSDGDRITLSDVMQDVDILDQTLYIGTRNGLLLYDLETDAIETYITDLFQEEE